MTHRTTGLVRTRSKTARRPKRAVAGLVAIAMAFLLPGIAVAHNLGHVVLPDGQCLEIGSDREAPLVGQDRTQLDLVPQTANPPRDEYGVSFVGFYGNTPIHPGPCRTTSISAASTNVVDELLATQPVNGL